MLSIAVVGDAVVLTVAGHVDVTDAVALRNEIARVMGENPDSHIIVDASAAERLGPRGLALLVEEDALCRRRGGDLHVVLGARDAGALGRVLSVYDNIDAALADIGHRGRASS
ncbi:MAG: anti-sigma factor antagonist [Myxococcales bacterium]|nr:anti-sigma factor antagonist [Myxococcales bacterium]